MGTTDSRETSGDEEKEEQELEKTAVNKHYHMVPGSELHFLLTAQGYTILNSPDQA
ncbi:hypothetical protein JXQ70_01805 [bacterium]|nr:hypothetical protein [bacterium]